MKKKSLIIFLCLSLIFGSYRDAKAVLLNPAALAAAGISLFVVGGVYYYMTKNGTSTLSNGYFQRQAQASYLAGASAAAYALTTKNLLSHLSAQSVQNAALNNQSLYPKLFNAASPIGSPPFQFSSLLYDNFLRVDNFIDYGGSIFRVTAVNKSSSRDGWTCSQAMGGSRMYYPSGMVVLCKDVSGGYDMVSYTLTPSTPDEAAHQPRLPATPEEFSQTVAPASAVNPDYQDELDKMMQNPAYVPTFTDESGLPWAPPADVVTPEQAASDLTQATSQAQQAVNQAAATSTAASAAAAANPSDPSLAAAAAAAQQALQDALDELAALQAALEELTGTGVGTDDPDDPAVDPGETPVLKSFSWEAARRLMGTLETAWPFNLLLSLRGLFAPLDASPVAPAFDLHIYQTNKLHVDLSFFDPVATILRWCFTLLLTSLGIMQVVRWYRGN